METFSFNTTLRKFQSSPLWGWYFDVPEYVATVFTKGSDRRVICTINEHIFIHCALMPNKGTWFILLNKENVKKISLPENHEISVKISKDNSEYGMPMPDELNEVLLQDYKAYEYFHALTPGKQRSLIYLINKIKSSEIKIRKSLVVADHLVANSGKLDHKLLYEGLRDYNKF